MGYLCSIHALLVENHTWSSSLADYIYNPYASDMAVHIVLYQSDVHHERDYPVCITSRSTIGADDVL